MRIEARQSFLHVLLNFSPPHVHLVCLAGLLAFPLLPPLLLRDALTSPQRSFSITATTVALRNVFSAGNRAANDSPHL